MSLPMDMCGFPTSITTHGNPTTTEDGAGMLHSDGAGSLPNLGDGASAITADGTGGLDWVGIGSPVVVGDLPGSIGIVGPLISVGVQSVIMAIQSLLLTIVFTDGTMEIIIPCIQGP